MTSNFNVPLSVSLTEASAARVITFLQITAPWRVPLIRAAASGRIAFLECARDVTAAEVRAGLRRANSKGRPCIAIIGDDDYRGIGPDGWPGAVPIIRWARVAIINGCGGQPEHYEAGIWHAMRVGRVAFVESSSAHAAAWCAAFSRCNHQLLIVPREGSHPVLPEHLS